MKKRHQPGSRSQMADRQRLFSTYLKEFCMNQRWYLLDILCEFWNILQVIFFGYFFVELWNILRQYFGKKPSHCSRLGSTVYSSADCLWALNSIFSIYDNHTKECCLSYCVDFNILSTFWRWYFLYDFKHSVSRNTLPLQNVCNILALV